jgi:ribosomal silencing factor RsfS
MRLPRVKKLPSLSRLQNINSAETLNAADITQSNEIAKVVPLEKQWFIDTNFRQNTTTAIEEHKPFDLNTKKPFVLNEIVNYLQELSAENIVIIDMKKACARISSDDQEQIVATPWTDKMIICEGSSLSHVNRITEAIYLHVKDRVRRLQSEGAQVECWQEGDSDCGWRLIDVHSVSKEQTSTSDHLSDFVVHVFTKEMRENYDLEGLWGGTINNKRE